MQYARLGHTGLIVSRLSFGTMTFGRMDGPLSSVYKVDQALANDLVARAVDAGVNFFDTSDAYAAGQGEEMLGRALAGKRDDVVISTKVGYRTADPVVHAGLSRRHVIASCEGSLRRLGTDYLDVYLLHVRDPFTPVEETLDALDFLVRQGMVRYVGYSNYAAWEAAKMTGVQRERKYTPMSVAQMYYSLVGRDVEHEILPFLEDAGVGLMVWSPLAGGFLSGKYTPETLGASEHRLSGFDFLPLDKTWGFEVVEHLRRVGEKYAATPAQVALAWLLAKPAVTTVLVGASSVAQLDDNLGAANVTLTPDDVHDLDARTAALVPYPGWFNARFVDAVTQNALIRGVAERTATPT